MPLGGSYPTFVLNYWPGAIECCDRAYTTCKSFQLHLTSHHIPPKKPPHMSILPTNPTVTAGPSSSSSVIDRRNGWLMISRALLLRCGMRIILINFSYQTALLTLKNWNRNNQFLQSQLQVHKTFENG